MSNRSSPGRCFAFWPGQSIDLLKIDIEGSENGLFSLGTERWLDRVRNLCIELHGEECERAFRSAMQGYRYEQARSGEYLPEYQTGDHRHVACLPEGKQSSKTHTEK